jgi:hypothetical protein
MLEVGMAVEEGKAISAPPPEGEERSEHYAAVPAQNHREPAAVEGFGYGVGGVTRNSGDSSRVQDFSRRVAHVGIWRHFDARDIWAAQTLVQTRAPQRVGSLLKPARAKAQRRRNFDDLQTHHAAPVVQSSSLARVRGLATILPISRLLPIERPDIQRSPPSGAVTAAGLTVPELPESLIAQ